MQSTADGLQVPTLLNNLFSWAENLGDLPILLDQPLPPSIHCFLACRPSPKGPALDHGCGSWTVVLALGVGCRNPALLTSPRRQEDNV